MCKISTCWSKSRENDILQLRRFKGNVSIQNLSTSSYLAFNTKFRIWKFCFFKFKVKQRKCNWNTCYTCMSLIFYYFTNFNWKISKISQVIETRWRFVIIKNLDMYCDICIMFTDMPVYIVYNICMRRLVDSFSNFLEGKYFCSVFIFLILCLHHHCEVFVFLSIEHKDSKISHGQVV